MKFYSFFRRKDKYHVALCKFQTKHDWIRDGNIEIRILHKISEILVYKTSGHQIFHHIPPISWTKMLIIYFRPKMPKLTRDIYLKKPLKIKACIGSNFRVPNSLTCKLKKTNVQSYVKVQNVGRSKVSLISTKFR